MIRGTCCFCLLMALAGTAGAGEFNEVLSVGDVAPAWKDLPGVDGKTHSLADLKDTPIVVVVFTCNSCPIAASYEDRLIKFAGEHGGDNYAVSVVAINVNKNEEDWLPKMQERAKEKKFNFPYLYDESQQIARDFGAVFTPQFFVLDRERKVVYMGRMDNELDPEQPDVNYLEETLQAIGRKKKPETGETLPIGCRIRFERTRKRPAQP